MYTFWSVEPHNVCCGICVLHNVLLIDSTRKGGGGGGVVEEEKTMLYLKICDAIEAID